MNGARYEIRLAAPGDEAAIRELFKEMLRSVCGADDAEGYPEGYLDKFFSDREDLIYAAELGSEVIAYLSVEVYRAEGYVYLDDLSVTAAHRGRGVGSALIELAETYALELGIPDVVFHVAKSNVRAFRLYERKGYSVFRDDGDRYLMHKSLPKV